MISAALLRLVVVPALYYLQQSWTSGKMRGSTSLNAGILIILLCPAGLSCVPASLCAQQSVVQDSLPAVGLKEAVDKAIEYYPQIQAARLEIGAQEALKKTAWDLGNTIVFTGGEENGRGGGVYTQFGIQQGNIDLFGIAPRLELQRQRVALAESALDLSVAEVEREVSRAWSAAYAARNIFWKRSTIVRKDCTKKK